jgi:hypothetical protein
MGNTVSRSDLDEQSSQQLPPRVVEETISFDPQESFALCIGLDKQAQPMTASLGKLVQKDTLSLAESFAKHLGLPERNVKTIISSQSPKRLLTVNGLATLLVEAAWKVGPKGILIFTFSGHGIEVAPNEYSLMLVNHSKTTHDYIVASDFLKLIQKEAEFKGKKVLLVLDCCHAGGIPQSLANTEEGRATFSAIAACNSYQSSIQLFPLGHSVFSYFLLDALAHQSVEPGKIPLHILYDSIHRACSSLSSLFIPYSATRKTLEGFKVDPVVVSKGREDEQTDAIVETAKLESGHAGRFQILHSYWSFEEFEKIKISFSGNCYRWLKKQASPTGPLQTLHDLGQLEKPAVLNACLSAMCQSIACIHLYEECPVIGKARQFIKDFTEIYAVVESTLQKSLQDITPITVESGIIYYYTTVKNVTDASELKLLYNKVMGFEQTDSDTTDVESLSALDKLVESLYPMEELQVYSESPERTASLL